MTELPGGLARSVALLDAARRPASAPLDGGYLDLLGGEDPQRGAHGRVWRPLLGWIAKGPFGPSSGAERRLARALLELGPGDGVLDVDCGAGTLTRDFARIVGDQGVVVGFDGSRSLLARAVRDTPAAAAPGGNVAFVRGDVMRLPFRDASFDAVCCFAALHLLDAPWTALDEMARVLTPGGRIALLTSCRTRTAPARTWDALVGSRLLGMRMFERDEVTDALASRGFEGVRRRVAGLAQFVGARKAAPPPPPRRT